jgi:hypothetical protein
MSARCRAYLVRRGELVDFFHNQLREVVSSEFLRTKPSASPPTALLLFISTIPLTQTAPANGAAIRRTL